MRKPRTEVKTFAGVRIIVTEETFGWSATAEDNDEFSAIGVNADAAVGALLRAYGEQLWQAKECPE